MLVIGARVAKKAGLDGYWKRLAERVADSPMPAAAKPAAKRQTLSPKKKDSFPAARAAIAAGFEKAGATTYSVLPVTKIAHGSHQELVKVEEGLGKGMSWGRVLHRLFEAILRDETLNVKLYAESLLKDEEREPAEIGDVLSVVEALRRSELWQRVLSSPHRLMEVPFAVLVPSAEIGLGEGPDTLLHGAIDLVFLEDDVWHVVDYKTDSTKEGWMRSWRTTRRRWSTTCVSGHGLPGGRLWAGSFSWMA